MSSRDQHDPSTHEEASGAGHGAVVPQGGPELLDDGQEEVFAYTAVAKGVVEDPKAMGPEDLARVPKSPISLAAGADGSTPPDPQAAPQSSSE